MIRALCIVFACLTVGHLVVETAHLRFPASIIGMCVLFLLLQSGVVKADWLQSMTDILMQNLSLFLVPPCVAVMDYLAVVQRDLLSITVATVASTFLVLYVSAKTHEWIRRRL